MATPVIFPIYNQTTGALEPSATPVFTNYASRLGVTLTPPPIVNRGDGTYQFTPSDAHAAAGLVWVITTGANPRRYSGAIAPDDQPLAALLLEDGAGNLFGGPGTPSFTSPGFYEDLANNPRTPPSLVTIGTHLFAFSPSAADVTIGISWAAQSPAGSRPSYYTGQFDAFAAGGGNTTPDVDNGQPIDFGSDSSEALGKALPIGRDIALDPETHDLLVVAGDLDLVSDGAAIRQEADVRMRFFLGEWFLDQTQGLPYFQNILVKAPNLAAIKTAYIQEILAVDGIDSVREVNLDYDREARRLRVTWSATTDLGALVSGDLNL